VAIGNMLVINTAWQVQKLYELKLLPCNMQNNKDINALNCKTIWRVTILNKQ